MRALLLAIAILVLVTFPVTASSHADTGASTTPVETVSPLLPSVTEVCPSGLFVNLPEGTKCFESVPLASLVGNASNLTAVEPVKLNPTSTSSGVVTLPILPDATTAVTPATTPVSIALIEASSSQEAGVLSLSSVEATYTPATQVVERVEESRVEVRTTVEILVTPTAVQVATEEGPKDWPFFPMRSPMWLRKWIA